MSQALHHETSNKNPGLTYIMYWCNVEN